MWPFKDKDLTEFQIEATNRLNHSITVKVYDCGNGAYVKSFFTKYPQYLLSNGKFDGYGSDCNGEYVSWKIHKGDKTKLKFRG